MSMKPDHWCKNLCWKGADMDGESLPRVAEVFAEGGVTYSCLTTAQPFGADDHVAAPETCVSGRTCYIPHPRLYPPSV